MRMYSIIQWQQFASMIISLALLGYGASGVFLVITRRRLERHFTAAFGGLALLFSVAMLACFSMAQALPFRALELLWDHRQPVYLCAVYLLLAFPFFCAATIVGLTLDRFRQTVGSIYRADLVGAGCGAFLTLALLAVVTPSGSLRVLALLPTLAAVLAAQSPTQPSHLQGPARKPGPSGLFRAQPAQSSSATRHSLAVGVAALAAAALALLWPQSALEPRASPYKGLSRTLELAGARVLSTHSASLSLLTVVDNPTVAFHYAPGVSLASRLEPPPQLAVFRDGERLSVITHYDGRKAPLAYLDQMLGALPYQLLQQPKVLVLDAGGGSDVLAARYREALRIDAVERDHGLVELVQGLYGDFAGHLYDPPAVRVHAVGARAFLARTAKRFDLIQLGPAASPTASRTGLRSSNASFLYTVEAFQQLLAHLEPGGFVAVSLWLDLPPRASLKLLTTVRQALVQSGRSHPERHLVLARSQDTTTLLVKESPVTSREVSVIRDFCSTRLFDLAYYPSMPRAEANRYSLLREPYFYDAAQALLGNEREHFTKRYKFDVEPATDDRPFFSHFFKWRTLPEILSLREQGGLPLLAQGYLLLIATLAQALLATAALILIPWRRLGARLNAAAPAATREAGPAEPPGLRQEVDWQEAKARAPRRTRVAAYFFALGLAFLFIEVAFLDRFTLFLGHPLYAAATVLAGFLVFAGLGSGNTERLRRAAQRTGRPATPLAASAVALTLLAYLYLLPVALDHLMPLADPAKLVLALLIVAPAAWLMGMPFPLGLSTIARQAPELLPWAWGINGCASVLGPLLATIVAIHFGYAAVVAMAAALYLLAAVVLEPGFRKSPLRSIAKSAGRPTSSRQAARP